MQEIYLKWEPISGLKRKYYVDEVYKDKNGFTVILISEDDPKNILKVTWSNWVDCYREANESFMWASLSDNKYETIDWGEWTFFKVKNSNYIKSFSRSSGSVSQLMDWQHFSFICGDTILDVLSKGLSLNSEFIESRDCKRELH